MVDKEHLYGVFNRSAERRSQLHEMALAKALDLPLTEGINMTSNVHNPGMGKTALMCLALLGAGSGGTLALGNMLGWFNPAPTQSAAPAMESQQYEVRFWTEDGTQIDVNEETVVE
jgi:hypothetical protein